MPTQAPVYQLPKKHNRQKPKQPQPNEPLPWHEGEPPEPPQPPFLPAA